MYLSTKNREMIKTRTLHLIAKWDYMNLTDSVIHELIERAQLELNSEYPSLRITAQYCNISDNNLERLISEVIKRVYSKRLSDETARKYKRLKL